MARVRTHRRHLAIWVVAIAVHGLLVLLLRPRPTQEPLFSPPSSSLAQVELVSVPVSSNVGSGQPLPLKPTIPVLSGAADQVGTRPDDSSSSTVNAPGAELGRRAEGHRGIEVFVDRRDRGHRSTAPRNVVDNSQMQQPATLPAGRRSPEALVRVPNPSFSDRSPQPRAIQGSKLPNSGSEGQTGQGGAPGEDGTHWASLDPRFDSAPPLRQQEVSGDFRQSQEASLADQGSLATENPLRGAASQRASAPARSNRPVVSAFDLGAPSTGGDKGLGAGGPRGRSLAGQAVSGTGTRKNDGSGRSLASAHATKSNPYFYQMYRKIDRELRFPKKLALALEQGQVVLAFRLQKDGRVRDLKIRKGSGFKAFDQEALRAFRAAGPFGPVPKTLLGNRSEFRVVAPYEFRNPLIR